MVRRSEVLSLVLRTATKSRAVFGKTLFVVVTRTSFPHSCHTIDLELRTKAAVAPDLVNSARHRLFELLERGAAEAIATKDLRLLFSLGLVSFAHTGLPLGEADMHVFLSFKEREDGSGLFSTLNQVNQIVGEGRVKAENSTEDVLAVEA